MVQQRVDVTVSVIVTECPKRWKDGHEFGD
jgi:hypothetical protein